MVVKKANTVPSVVDALNGLQLKVSKQVHCQREGCAEERMKKAERTGDPDRFGSWARKTGLVPRSGVMRGHGEWQGVTRQLRKVGGSAELLRVRPTPT